MSVCRVVHQRAEQEREQEREQQVHALKTQAEADKQKLSQELEVSKAADEGKRGQMADLNERLADAQAESRRLLAQLDDMAARLQATEELKRELEKQVQCSKEQLEVGERAVEHNRSQSIIMDELRHRVSSQDALLRQKDAQVQELIAQRDEAEHKLFEFRGTEQHNETLVRGLEQQRNEIQQQLVSAVSVGQTYHAEAYKLKEKAVRTKEMMVRRIISQWLYESVSQAFYGWSSLIGGSSQTTLRYQLPADRLSASSTRVLISLCASVHEHLVLCMRGGWTRSCVAHCARCR